MRTHQKKFPHIASAFVIGDKVQNLNPVKIPLCVCVCVRAYVRACVRACVRVCVCVEYNIMII